VRRFREKNGLQTGDKADGPFVVGGVMVDE
jgi:hypothetical protein